MIGHSGTVELPFTIRPSGAAYRAFLWCIGGTAAFLAVLLVWRMHTEPFWGDALMAVIIGLLCLSMAKIAFTRIDIDDDGLTLRGLLAPRRVRFAEIAGVTMHGRVLYRDIEHFLRIALLGPQSKPLDIRTDFLEYRDVKALRTLLQERIGPRL